MSTASDDFTSWNPFEHLWPFSHESGRADLLLGRAGVCEQAAAAQHRQQEIADISQGIKALAKELKVPIIVLAQLNRELEKREPGAKPKLSDLRESGSIEQDADLVGLLYKPKLGKEDDEEPPDQASYDAVPVNLLIAKQRNGPTGDVHLTFMKGYTRFENAAKVASEDAPGE